MRKVVIAILFIILIWVIVLETNTIIKLITDRKQMEYIDFNIK